MQPLNLFLLNVLEYEAALSRLKLHSRTASNLICPRKSSENRLLCHTSLLASDYTVRA